MNFPQVQHLGMPRPLQYMKQLLTILSLAAVLVACKDSQPLPTQNDPEIDAPSVVGDWSMSSYREEGTVTANNAAYASYWLQSNNEVASFSFKDDGSYTYSLSYDYDAKYTYTNGQEQEFSGSHPTITESGSYTYSESTEKLRLQPSSGKVEYSVSLLSEDSLHFSKPFYIQDVQGGVVYVNSGLAYYQLTR